MEQVYRIGIDHGYGNIKTAHHIFQSGVIQKGSITELSGMMKIITCLPLRHCRRNCRAGESAMRLSSLRQGSPSSGWKSRQGHSENT